jgi:hypothetical protein
MLERLPKLPRDRVFEARKSQVNSICVEPAGGNFFPQGCEYSAGGVGHRNLSLPRSECRQLWIALEFVYRGKFPVQVNIALEFHC